MQLKLLAYSSPVCTPTDKLMLSAINLQKEPKSEVYCASLWTCSKLFKVQWGEFTS